MSSIIENFEQPVLVIGASHGGMALLEVLSQESHVHILGVVDTDPDALGITFAKSIGIKVYADIEDALRAAGPCIVFNMTHDTHLADIAARYVGAGSVLGGHEARFFWHIITRLKSLKNELMENQIRMQAVLHNIREGIISIKPNGIIEDVNPAIEALFGYTQAELVGQPINILMPEPHRTAHDAYLANYERTGEKHVIGRYREVVAKRKDGSEFPLELSVNEMELSGTKHFVGLVRDITDRKIAENKLTQLAMYDQLTGLPNRTNFFERLSLALSQASRAQSCVALLFIDLDGFKTVNDTLGHDMGDHVLVEVAQRLKDCIRESDTSARLGGDEFTIILNNLNNAQSASHIADKIINAINLPILHNGQTCHVGASIGIAIYPDHATHIDELIGISDTAMYRSKGKGKNSFTLGNT